MWQALRAIITSGAANSAVSEDIHSRTASVAGRGVSGSVVGRAPHSKSVEGHGLGTLAENSSTRLTARKSRFVGGVLLPAQLCVFSTQGWLVCRARWFCEPHC